MIGDFEPFRPVREVHPAQIREVPEIEIRVDLGAGRGCASLWTCDLSYDYVKINAEYTT